jgi:hypothetical protein
MYTGVTISVITIPKPPQYPYKGGLGIRMGLGIGTGLGIRTRGASVTVQVL